MILMAVLIMFSIMTAAARWDGKVCSGGEARKMCVEQKSSPALG
jgi:hypothetical protein